MICEGEIPSRSTTHSVGYDFRLNEDLVLRPNEWVKIDTGVRFDGSETILSGGVPLSEWFMAIFPRSSLGMNYGMRFHNTVGIIDMDFRKNIELDVTVDKECVLHKGNKIAQGIFLPMCLMAGEKVPTEVRKGGMGSTGQ